MLLIRLSHGYPEVTHSSLYCLLAFSTFGRQAGGVTAIAPRVQGRTSEVHKGSPWITQQGPVTAKETGSFQTDGTEQSSQRALCSHSLSPSFPRGARSLA